MYQFPQNLHTFIFIKHFFRTTFLHNNPCKLTSVVRCCSWGLMALLEGTSAVTAEEKEESVTNCSSPPRPPPFCFWDDCTQVCPGSYPVPCAETLMCKQHADLQPGEEGAASSKLCPETTQCFFRKAITLWLFLMHWIIRTAGWHIWTTGGRGGWALAYTVCLSQNKSSSLAYIVSIRGNLRWMLGELSECFSVGGIAVVLIVSNYALIRWSLETITIMCRFGIKKQSMREKLEMKLR